MAGSAYRSNTAFFAIAITEPRLCLQEGEGRAGKAPVEPNENARPRTTPGSQPRQ